jgi:hypothetical protein
VIWLLALQLSLSPQQRHYDNARDAMAKMQFSQADEEVDLALKADPNFVSALILKSRLALFAHRPDIAKSCLIKAISIEPSSESAQVFLGRFLLPSVRSGAGTISDPSVTVRGFTLPYATFPSSSSLAQALRPYPQFNGVGIQKAMVGNYWYDSLQIKMRKRLSNGLWFLGTYTWSKDLGTVDDEWGDSVPVANASLPPKSQKTYTAVDTPHITSVAFKYILPHVRSGGIRLEESPVWWVHNRRNPSLFEWHPHPGTQCTKWTHVGDVCQ